tara:strand:+ start:300 stop:740 length:441 start_codon:yes stop_codon:yes gene_type:complete
MANYAKIGMNGKVIAVVHVNDEDNLNSDGVEDEKVGQYFCERFSGWAGEMWVKTSANTLGNQHSNPSKTPLRGNFAGIGYTWDEENQIFWQPQPYPSWTKNISTASWEAPVAEPSLTEEQISENDAKTANHHYEWNEEQQTWNYVN